ncbi:hypothetical protein [Methylocella sp. CPCC 101449]|uniref:hypothetical protein n=1 Tax=Methylocella sp. CPCC 101449 TaxID=2987531 RepID=UPI00288C94E1|nr:hypothetical protein [Methylocella sp. CPCC 101449]MDT2021020.1 hypothetical protein [Methylocella sp. CPCC 101449]
MRSRNWSESRENNGFSYAMPPELAQQQLRMSVRLVAVMAFAIAIALVATVRAPEPAKGPTEAHRNGPPVMTFVADNAPVGSATVHLR